MTDNGHIVVDLSSHNDAQAVHEIPLLQTFLRGNPKTLGAVQIVIGGVMFMFGVELTIYMHSMSAGCGFLFWGGLMFVIAGTLSIVTDRKLTLNLVKASLGINIVSSITAMIGIILHSLDLSTFAYLYKIQLQSKCVQPWILYLSRTVSISAAMLILSLLELIIAIYLCVFAFKATCSHHFHPKQAPSAALVERPCQRTPKNPDFLQNISGVNLQLTENSPAYASETQQGLKDCLGAILRDCQSVQYSDL